MEKGMAGAKCGHCNLTLLGPRDSYCHVQFGIIFQNCDCVLPRSAGFFFHTNVLCAALSPPWQTLTKYSHTRSSLPFFFNWVCSAAAFQILERNLAVKLWI